MAFGDLFNPLLSAVKLALKPFSKLWDIVTRFWNSVTTLLPKAQDLGVLIVSEVAAWRNFKEAIPYRTGVVSFPRAVEKSRELLQEVFDAWHAIVDLVRELKNKFTAGGDTNPAEEAQSAIEDIEKSGFGSILKQLPKLARSVEKVLGFLVVLADGLESIVTLVDDLTTIVNAVKDIREEVETGSTIFLSQKNSRKTLKTKDGRNFKIRVGSLHPS